LQRQVPASTLHVELQQSASTAQRPLEAGESSRPVDCDGNGLQVHVKLPLPVQFWLVHWPADEHDVPIGAAQRDVPWMVMHCPEQHWLSTVQVELFAAQAQMSFEQFPLTH
jgi:hypothetical protein